MNFIEVQQSDGIVTLVLSRGKVNALNGMVVDELEYSRNFSRLQKSNLQNFLSASLTYIHTFSAIQSLWWLRSMVTR